MDKVNLENNIYKMGDNQSSVKSSIFIRVRRKLIAALNPLHKKIFRFSPRLGWFISQISQKKGWQEWLEKNKNDDQWLKIVLEYFGLKENENFGNNILVDIGSGPIGILTKLRAERRIAIDPMPINKNDKIIERICSPGENIPLHDESVDRVFIYNVLQHVISPGKVLGEGKRILKKGGIFYILENLNVPVDISHPHSLRSEMFEGWLQNNNFEIIKKNIEVDCWLDVSKSVKGSGYATLCLILKKR